jgi:hypothetical protein
MLKGGDELGAAAAAELSALSQETGCHRVFYAGRMLWLMGAMVDAMA